MEEFKQQVLARVDAHELRHNRTESAIQTMYEMLNEMRVWMDKEAAASQQRFADQTRDFKAYVDMRHEETLSEFRVFRDELREQGQTLRGIERRLKRLEERPSSGT